jgi:hypothetical protein
VPLPEREREALAVDGPGQVGLVAALFLEDARDEGRWLLVDATAIRERDAASARLGREALRRMGRTQPHLGELRAHLDAGFPRFLQGFLDEALEGHDALVAALGSLHASGALERRLPDWDVLDSEHRGNLRTLVERHGESGAGESCRTCSRTPSPRPAMARSSTTRWACRISWCPGWPPPSACTCR